MSEKKNQNVLGGIIAFLVVIGVIWYNFGGGMERHATSNMQKIERQVAADAVKQYEIAKRNGSATDAYVQAGLVAAAYLQAKDEANYRKWKEIQRQEAKRAGIPAD